MVDYTRSITEVQSSINKPAVQTDNFEIKPNIIRMVQNNVQFDGLPDEDPNLHINFLEVCDTFKINEASEDTIYLSLFLFSLRDKMKSWLKLLLPGSITNWDTLAHTFFGT